MRRKPLERFEAIAKRLVEGSFGRLFGGRLDPLEISAEIAAAIEDHHRNGIAPNEFIVSLHPVDFTYIRTEWPDAVEVLTHYALQIVREHGLSLATDPVIELQASPDISRHYAHVTATHHTPLNETTSVFEPIQQYDPLDALHKLDAFVILNGQRHIPLNKSIITLGRRNDCDIVLDSKSVSRRHAQLRWRFGRFIVYDLGSRAGTVVNDQPVTEFALRPGDVIELAEISLIYGEGLTTKPLDKPHSEDQATEAHPRTRIH
ncbi:MAG: FhaA domain-containing protein [Candidatus Promineifilaceae bacterium]